MSKRPGYEDEPQDPGILNRLRSKLRIGDRVPAELMEKSPYREADGGLPGQARATKGHQAPRVPRPLSVQEAGWDTPISDEKIYVPHDDEPVQIPRAVTYPGGAQQFREDLGTALGRDDESWLRRRGVRRRGVW